MSVQYVLKAVTALITGLIGWATAVVNSAEADVSASEWIALATVVAVALGVFLVPNEAKSQPPA